MIDYQLVSSTWIDFLDSTIVYSKAYGLDIYFKKNAKELDDLGYINDLSYFIAMALDSASWSPHELSKQLGLPIETIKSIHQHFSDLTYEEIPYDTVIWSSTSDPSVIRKEWKTYAKI